MIIECHLEYQLEYANSRIIPPYCLRGKQTGASARPNTNGGISMPNHARCCVGFCDNDKRFPDLLVVKSHVRDLKFHRWPKDPKLADLWTRQVLRGRSDNFKPEPGSEGTFVCSNHFPEGKRTPKNPSTDYPSLFLTLSDFLQKPSPKKRKVRDYLSRESETESDDSLFLLQKPIFLKYEM